MFNSLNTSGNYMYHQFEYCPHGVFMFFERVSEQTAITSLYSIKWMVFITKKDSVYRAVRTKYLNMSG
jgi:hypothetical protein